MEFINNFVDICMADNSINKLNIKIFNANDTLHSICIGKPHKETASPWGCTSKLISDYSLRLLCLEKNISLDTPVSSLTCFKNKNTFINEHMSILDCISHRVKIPLDELYILAAIINGYSMQQIVSHVNGLELCDAFRTKAHYNNINYILIGAIIETIAQKNYVEHVEKTMLDIGMKNTGIINSINEINDKGIVLNTFKIDRHYIPAIGIVGELDDKVKFGQLFLYKKEAMEIFNGGYATIRKHTSRLPINGFAGAWGFRLHNGVFVYIHSGALIGYSNVLAILPEYGIGCFVEIEEINSIIPNMFVEMLIMHLTDKDININKYIKEYKKTIKVRKVALTNLISDVNIMYNFTGCFFNEFLGYINIFENNGIYYIAIKNRSYEIINKKSLYFYLLEFDAYVGISVISDLEICLKITNRSYQYVFKKV